MSIYSFLCLLILDCGLCSSNPTSPNMNSLFPQICSSSSKLMILPLPCHNLIQSFYSSPAPPTSLSPKFNQSASPCYLSTEYILNCLLFPFPIIPILVQTHITSFQDCCIISLCDFPPISPNSPPTHLLYGCVILLLKSLSVTSYKTQSNFIMISSLIQSNQKKNL